ncbi:LLM class flavin-dependent oxidoreductase [Yinghuangia seranimata]|uniref:LLM class flavin-dependent oxidoreductase n=1 Tax=Yinghuangia seranimata TaxID=408067 RepID=UPI00248B27C6|nr:LLM class flavin-dependent oxidoreductase [Yinghuangia seranimata]MDI2131361.1 LLM class flavin-dependent oxidoreductase [Yinghuangia seranimata]
MPLHAIPLSVLDLAPVGSGYTATEALRTSTELARRAERWGFHRFWVAEHHNMPGIASSAPPVLLAHLAAHTSTLRLGSGGIMLPNHAPLVVAEQFGTLQALHPGRIDIGIGRAPGTDQATARALRRSEDALSVDDFPQQLGELIGFLTASFREGHLFERIRAVPGPVSGIAPGGEWEASRAPVWLLGSSGYSARLAGALGLPFAFAHHFSAVHTLPALALYREHFTPSEDLDKPYSMIAAGVIAADTDEEARRYALAQALAMLRLRTGRPGLLPSPDEAEQHPWTEAERDFVRTYQADHIIGGPATVRAGLDELVSRTGVDELMVVSNVHGHDARLRSYEIIAEQWGLPGV